MTRTIALAVAISLFPLLGSAACSNSRPIGLPYDPDRTTVIAPDGQVDVVATPTGDGCLELADGPRGACITPQEQCPGGIADVVVDRDGEVIEVVCLPPEADYVSPVIDGQIPQDANNSVLEFDDEGLGVYEDDLNVDGNNVVLYGDDPAEATLEGNLTIDGNNAVVRGITITGNVDIVKNDATFVYCVILGNVTISANNALITGCEIWGNVIVTGNNARLNGNRINGNVEDGGNNFECRENYDFSDEDGDGVITADEIGARIDC